MKQFLNIFIFHDRDLKILFREIKVEVSSNFLDIWEKYENCN